MVSARSLQRKEGLPLWSQISGWLLLCEWFLLRPRIADRMLIPSVYSSTFAFRTLGKAQDPTFRLMVLMGSFAPIFIILSISYEALFYCAFIVNLYLWLVLESTVPRKERKIRETPTDPYLEGEDVPVDGRHLRIALYALFFIHVGFFGTGNVASISSFYLEPVYRLVPVFNPFLMTILLLYKILIPFLAIAVTFAELNRRLRLPPSSLLLMAMGMSDVLALAFFFLVRDEGSWLDIGQSISHFSIASLLIVFMSALFGVGQRVMAR